MARKPKSLITPRQADIVRLVKLGMSNKEIARTLRISENTVGFHVSQLLKRLGVDSRIKAVLWVERNMPELFDDDKAKKRGG